MIKSEMITKLHQKFNSLSSSDVEKVVNLFCNKLSNSLYQNRNIEIRGFGSFKKKINKAKFVRNPKTNEKIFKKETYKINFKISKVLHQRINGSDSNS